MSGYCCESVSCSSHFLSSGLCLINRYHAPTILTISLTTKPPFHTHYFTFCVFSQSFSLSLSLSLSFTYTQGSRWTLQATRMNGRLGKFVLQPDQMQALNPILILVFIPIFETIVYPIFGKCKLLKKYGSLFFLFLIEVVCRSEQLSLRAVLLINAK